jgi:membrane-bound metal-dependent hydrolase YbcI (DUF457 family)
MPTPVGHAIGGLAVYLAARDRPIREDLPIAVACAGASLLPDLDFAIGPFAGRSYHHYFTHSLGFTALFALAAYLVCRFLGRTRSFRDAMVLSAAYLSHIFLDMLGRDTTPPFGVQLFWPLSDVFTLSPVSLFDEVRRGTLGKLFGLHNWLAVAKETLILGPITVLLWWKRSLVRPSPLP